MKCGDKDGWNVVVYLLGVWGRGGMGVSHRRTCKGEMVCVLVSTRAFLGGVLWRKRALRVF